MHFILVLIALLANGGSGPGAGDTPGAGADDGNRVDPAESATITAPEPVAEPQEPTGRFTTATEVRPILNATKANWVAVREYEGRDLVYFTHLLSWRCGLIGLEYAINDGPVEAFALPDCHEDTGAPNALLPADGLPYVSFGLQTVDKIRIHITYDDLARDTIVVARNGVLIP